LYCYQQKYKKTTMEEENFFKESPMAELASLDGVSGSMTAAVDR
jgi:hypothetical protein